MIYTPHDKSHEIIKPPEENISSSRGFNQSTIF